MTKNDQKWPKMTKNDQKWHFQAQNDLKWHVLTQKRRDLKSLFRPQIWPFSPQNTTFKKNHPVARKKRVAKPTEYSADCPRSQWESWKCCFSRNSCNKAFAEPSSCSKSRLGFSAQLIQSRFHCPNSKFHVARPRKYQLPPLFYQCDFGAPFFTRQFPLRHQIRFFNRFTVFQQN